MNKFSITQYILISFVLILGFTYALPNLYPTQPSIQVAYTDSGKSADQVLLNNLKEILNTDQVNYEDIFLRDNKIVIKFSSLENQLESKTILQNALLFCFNKELKLNFTNNLIYLLEILERMKWKN